MLHEFPDERGLSENTPQHAAMNAVPFFKLLMEPPRVCCINAFAEDFPSLVKGRTGKPSPSFVD